MPRTGAPIAALALAALVATSVAQAQEWPTRPVTMVVPFAAGGPVDVLGRILAQYLGEAIGKQVIVDNVPGGGGMTGSLRVSQAAPDGYMFVLGLDRHPCAQSNAVQEAAVQRRHRFRPGRADRRCRRWC